MTNSANWNSLWPMCAILFTLSAFACGDSRSDTNGSSQNGGGTTDTIGGGDPLGGDTAGGRNMVPGKVPLLQFASEARYAACDVPGQMAIADLNGDSTPDIAVACEQGLGVGLAVLFGKGDGSFNPPVVYDTLGKPLGVVAADFDGSGSVDVAIAQYQAQNNADVVVFLNDGTGVLGSPFSSAAGLVTGAMAAGPLDTQAGADLVAGIVPDQLGIWVGGAAAPAMMGTIKEPYAIRMADMNQDGNTDAVVAGGFNLVGSLLVANGNGDGTLTPGPTTTNLATVVETLAVGDLDGDGAPDMAIGTGGVQTGRNNQDGTYTFSRIIPNMRNNIGSPSGLEIGDMDGDGNTDVVVLNVYAAGPGEITVLRGNGDGTVRAPDSFWGEFDSARKLTASDLNGDGKIDVVVSNSYTGEISVLLNTSQPTGGEKSDDQVCLQACNALRTCSDQELVTCHDECLLAENYITCVRPAPTDCTLAAACSFWQTCGDFQFGTGTCGQAAACQAACLLDGYSCTCDCVTAMAQTQAAKLYATNLCALIQCPDCSPGGDAQKCLDCHANACKDQIDACQ